MSPIREWSHIEKSVCNYEVKLVHFNALHFSAKNVFFSCAEYPLEQKKAHQKSAKYFSLNIRGLIAEDIASSTDARSVCERYFSQLIPRFSKQLQCTSKQLWSAAFITG